MNELFLPYKEAFNLKTLGFNEPCFGTFGLPELNGDDPDDLSTTDDGSLVRNTEIQNGIAAPLYQQALKWFRDKGYDVEIVSYHFHGKYIGKKYKYLIFKYDEIELAKDERIDDYNYQLNHENENDSYEAAELACIKQLIEELIIDEVKGEQK